MPRKTPPPSAPPPSAPPRVRDLAFLSCVDQVLTGDARMLSGVLPDDSVDLICTDPVYDRMDDYRWLGETAMRVLKPNSSALVWASSHQMLDAAKAMVDAGLVFRMPLQYVVVASCQRLIGFRCFTWATPCLWMVKGNGVPKRCTIDTVVSSAPPAGTHKWNKNPEAVLRWIGDFTDRGDLVFDPFTGGGTVPSVCKRLDRRYVAFEQDPVVAFRARERLHATMLPLFLPEDALQETFDLSEETGE